MHGAEGSRSDASAEGTDQPLCNALCAAVVHAEFKWHKLCLRTVQYSALVRSTRVRSIHWLYCRGGGSEQTDRAAVVWAERRPCFAFQDTRVLGQQRREPASVLIAEHDSSQIGARVRTEGVGLCRSAAVELPTERAAIAGPTVVHAPEVIVLSAAGEGASGRGALADEPLLDPGQHLLLLLDTFAQQPVLDFTLPCQGIDVLEAQIGLFNDRVERCECLVG